MMHQTQPGTAATNRPTAQLGLRPLWEPGPPGTSASYPQSKQGRARLRPTPDGLRDRPRDAPRRCG